VIKIKIPTSAKYDIFAGITAGVIALPMALGFGVASGLGPAAGLYGAIIVGLLAAIFGGTPTQIYGPTGPTTVFVAAIVALNLNNLSVVFAIIILCGIFQIILGLCKAGALIHLVPKPVVSGFMAGVGCIIIMTQITPFLGLTSQGNMIQALTSLLTLEGVNIQCIIIGAVTLLILSLKKIDKIIPVSFFALVVCTGACKLFNLNIPTSGAIPSGLPSITLAPISLEALFYIITVALGLALLASTDGLLTSLIADNMTKTKHDSNKELIGQGLGNMFSGIFGGTACSSSTILTVANIETGARTRLSGIVHALLLIMILLFLGPVVQAIPLAVLAGILIKVGLDVIYFGFFKELASVPKSDIVVTLAVLAITVFGNLLVAVGVGVALHAFIRRLSGVTMQTTQTKVENTEIEDSERLIRRVRRG